MRTCGFFERTCRDLLVPCERTELRCERVVKVQGYVCVWLHFQSQLLFVANILCLVHQVNKTAWWQGQNLCACCPLSSWFQVASAEASRWLCEDLKARSTCQNTDSFMQSLFGLSVLPSVELQRPRALQGLGFHTPVLGAVAGLVTLPGIQGCACRNTPESMQGPAWLQTYPFWPHRPGQVLTHITQNTQALFSSIAVNNSELTIQVLDLGCFLCFFWLLSLCRDMCRNIVTSLTNNINL